MNDTAVIIFLGFYFLGLGSFIYAILTAEMRDEDDDWDETTY
jgi:hypothetical protein